MELIKNGKIRWIHIVKPTEEDLEWLKQKFHFHPVIIDELKTLSLRARVESYDHYIYLIYHFPIYDVSEVVSKRSEVDFLITKEAVITIAYDHLEALGDFKKKLSNPNTKERTFQSSLHLTYNLITALLHFNERQLRHIQEKVERISTQLFKDREREVLEEISYVKRDISEYRIIVRPQEELLKSLFENGINFWGKDARVYLNDLIGDYLKLTSNLEAYREAVRDFDSTNNQLMNVKATQVMKTFTVLAFLTFPLMLFTSLFSMRLDGAPLLYNPNGFWVIVGIIVGAMIVMLALFKKKGWL